MKNFNNEENKGVVHKLKLVDRFRIHGRLIGLILGLVVMIACIAITAYGATTHTADIDDDGNGVTVIISTQSTTGTTNTTSITTTTTMNVENKSTCSSSLTTKTTKAKTEANTTVVHTYPIQVVSASLKFTNAVEEESEYDDECKTVDVDTYDVEETVEVHEHVVYKPSTKYIHKNNCKWVDDSCYEIASTEDIEARKCSDCNPDMVIVNEYTVPATTTETETNNTGTAGLTSLNYITETERVMLCNVVGGEYGSDWISQYDKACVVACVMNRYYDGGWCNGMDNTIYNVITAPGQFNSYYANTSYNSNVTDSCISAVEYYFENQSSFPHYTSFYGDGTRNYFR